MKKKQILITTFAIVLIIISFSLMACGFRPTEETDDFYIFEVKASKRIEKILGEVYYIADNGFTDYSFPQNNADSFGGFIGKGDVVQFKVNKQGVVSAYEARGQLYNRLGAVPDDVKGCTSVSLQGKPTKFEVTITYADGEEEVLTYEFK